MKKRNTMLAVDFRRMFRSRFFYIMVGICLVMPILILVMTSMMDGSVSVNPQTGVETTIEGFDNVWQIIGSVGGGSAGMDMMSMCNMNLLYFIISVLVCIFVAQDFRSGYAKNIFAIRAKKTDYVMSKTVVCSLAAMAMLLCFVIGSFIGGAIAGLPFEMVGFHTGNLVMCIFAKLLLAPVFVAIYLCMSIIAKEKAWLSILLSMMLGMFLFMMIPVLTPLDAGFMNVVLCLAGGILFSIGLGAISNLILKKGDIL